MFSKKWLFVGGAQRCGTTSLFNFISRSPGFLPVSPSKPEPKYLLDLDKNFDDIAGWESECSDDICILEKSTSYIEFSQVPQIIRDNFLRARILFMLRDPVERALSNYYFSKKNGLENRGLRDAIFDPGYMDTSYTTSVNPFNYVGRGFYSEYLSKFYESLPGEDIILVVMEKFYNEPRYRNEIMRIVGCNDLLDQDVEKLNSAFREYDQEKVEVVERLTDIYSDSNAALSKRYDLDLTLWR